MKTLYVFGNEFLEEDAFALRVAKHISGVHVVPLTSPDALLSSTEDELLLLDVVKNISEPMRITDIKQLKTRTMLSLHDFDVGYFLTLMQSMGLYNKVTIIGIPQTGSIHEIAKKVKLWISG